MCSYPTENSFLGGAFVCSDTKAPMPFACLICCFLTKKWMSLRTKKKNHVYYSEVFNSCAVLSGLVLGFFKPINYIGLFFPWKYMAVVKIIWSNFNKVLFYSTDTKTTANTQMWGLFYLHGNIFCKWQKMPF